MDKDYIEQERDELRSRLDDTTSIVIKAIKDELDYMKTTNPHRGHLGKSLRYFRSEQLNK